MAAECTCPWVAEELWTRCFGIAEPGSQREWDPSCPAHGGCQSVMRGFQCGLSYGHKGKYHLFHDEELDCFAYWRVECGVSAGGTQVALSKQDVDSEWAEPGPLG